MFSRRRAQSNPPARSKTPPTAAAHTAAAQAFLANRASNANLSNAAAAAALRSHTTSPIPVGEIQTRRMVRRGSVSSTGSGRPGGLQRRDSGGSMTDRTFRDPSPSRSSQPVYYDQDAPPVPALPYRYMSPPPVPVKSIRRPASVEPPERVLSPPPRPNGRGVSLDRGPGMIAGNRKGKLSKPAGNLLSVGEVTRGQASDTINFSRPMSPSNSPPSSPVMERRIASPQPRAGDTQRLNNTANVGKFRDGEAENIQYSLQETATAPVKKKKKKATANPDAAGSHLAAGTNAGRATGTAVESTPLRQSPSGDTTPSLAAGRPVETPADGNLKALPKKKKKKIASPGSAQAREPDNTSYASDSDSTVSERSNKSDRPRTYNTRAAGLLFKQPSIVREDREGEEIAEFSVPKPVNGRITGNDSANTSIAEVSVRALSNGKPKSQKVGQETSATAPANTRSLDVPQDVPNTNGVASTGIEPGTNRQSLSPSRAAHFSAQPIYETPDGVKHQPPARSVSPAKSALKHSPSRGASPVTGFPADFTRRRGPASEASDTTSVISEDGFHPLPKKKKSVRVSFDNELTVVGRAATPPTDPDSPVVMSPQAKRGSSKRWPPFAKDKTQHASGPSKDEDNVIQPTPALPSFGSIRERNEHDPRFAKSNRQQMMNQTEAPSMGASSDQRIGNILSRVFATDEVTSMTKPAESEASTDQVPPQTTSVEGTRYHSDTEGNSHREQDKELEIAETTPATSVAKTDIPETRLAATNESASEPVTESPHTPEQSVSVPLIAVQPATPRPDQADTFAAPPVSIPPERGPTIAVQPATPATEEKQVPQDYYRVHLPGEFPISLDPSDDDQQPSMPSIFQHRPTDPTPAAVGIAEPEPPAAAAYHDHSSPVIGGLAEGLRQQTAHDADEESEDTNHSIYSDAAEDISDLEGDGFGSINAIVESPAVTPQVLPEKQNVPESQMKGGKNGTRMPPNLLARHDSELSEPGPDAGWEQAQQYWSGLSQQRKQQMEQAAARKIEEESKEAIKPKPKKKKLVPKKSAQPTVEATDTGQPPLPPWPDRQYRDEIADSSLHKAPAMKKSMRASPNESSARPPTAMKKSMRGTQNVPTEEPTMRSSMRNQAPSKPRNRISSPPSTLPEPRDDLKKKQRPVSAVNMMDYNKPQGKPAVKHDRAVSLGGPSKPAPSVPATPPKKRVPVTKPLQRNDSDSSSSFKRARSTNLESGKYAMKRSMRGSSVDEQPQSTQGRSMSLTNRTASPAGSSRRPFSTAGSVGPTMRTSMRGSMEPTMRAKSPPRSFGFGKSKPKATSSGPKSRLSSRFGDSSDEEDSAVNRRSRFADSSDEEPDFTPVRGIPRRIDEGDSTDLEDSSDEKVAPKPQATQPQTSMSEGKALGARSLRPATGNATSPASPMTTSQQPFEKEKEKKKRSFFGALGSKKSPKPEPITLPTESQPRQTIPRTRADPVLASPPPASPLPPSSPNITTSISASPQAKKSPKLQRRISAQQAEKIQMNRGVSDTWPLPQSPGSPSTPTMRPSTSDGTPKKRGGLEPSGLGKEVIAEEARPGLGTRNDTVQSAYTNGVEAVAAVGQKKKKGWLRKAFGR